MTTIIISMLLMRKMRLKETGWQDFQNDENEETALQEKKNTNEVKIISIHLNLRAVLGHLSKWGSIH